MAVAFDACSSGNTTGTSLTFQHTCATGSVLYVFVGIDANSDFNPSVTYNGTSMTLISEHNTISYQACFRLLTPSTGAAYDVVVSGLPSGGEEYAFAVSLTGVDSGDPDDAPDIVTDAGASTSFSDSVATASGHMVLTFATLNNNGTTAHSATGGATIPTNGSQVLTSTANFLLYIPSDAATESPGLSWTNGSSSAVYSLNVRASSGGGAVPTITDAEDEAFYGGETGVMLTGSNFGSTQGAGRVVISPTDDINNVSAVEQTVTSWSASSIEFTVVRSSLSLNTNLYLFVEENGGASNAAGYVVQITGDKKIKLLLNSASVGATVDGVVFEAPVTGIVGPEVCEFTGQTVVAGSGADAGKGVLKIVTATFGGNALAPGDAPLVYVKNATNFTPIWAATVIVE